MSSQQQQNQAMMEFLNSFEMDMIPKPEYELLLSAAAKNDINRLQTLLAGGVPPSYVNGIGQTSLHIAVLWGHVDCAKVLIKAGANVNAANKLMGTTPLHLAVHGHKANDNVKFALVQNLLEAGADPGIEDRNRKAPIDYLEETNPYCSTLKQKLKRPPRDFRRLFVNDALSGGGCMVAPPTK